jgi:hypothetical protein
MHRTPTRGAWKIHDPTASITEHPCLLGLPRRGNLLILAFPLLAREIKICVRSPDAVRERLPR